MTRATFFNTYLYQIYQEKKQRQISLKKGEKELWEQARNYQKHVQSLLELKKTCLLLPELVPSFIH